MLQKCEGIVIRTTNYGESNKIVVVYSRELGKVAFMARGAKKPNSRFSGVSQAFTYAYFVFQKGKGLGTLQQGDIITSFKGIKEDLFKTAYVTYISDLLDKGTEELKPNPFLFELYQTILSYIEEGYDADILTNIFELKMLPVFGLQPGLNECAVCGQTEGDFSFSFRENGVVCHRCRENDRSAAPMSRNTFRLLRVLYYYDLNRLGTISVKKETKDELTAIIRQYYDENSGLYLKSRRFLDQIQSMESLLKPDSHSENENH
ncbi:DNA recombination protein RecO [Bacillus coahuilensis m2-6]|uniref:DNA repair protein RecO n=1 Tax=Bacillus coahuilensis TaxID=408580 RepID=UPI0007506D4C|nr:DNA repair protein RecO [Bacillus coahuilensis]KUP07228.1 DNA recombination protein RecO [Bacillus coahuilensis m2-6]